MDSPVGDGRELDTGMTNWNEATTRDAKLACIFTATSAEELREMWSAWERRGWARTGILYGFLLEQLRDRFGVELTPEEEALAYQAKENREEGRHLPPITGVYKGGNG